MQSEAAKAEEHYETIMTGIREAMEKEGQERQEVEKRMDEIRKEIQMRTDRVANIQQKQKALQGRLMIVNEDDDSQ